MSDVATPGGTTPGGTPPATPPAIPTPTPQGEVVTLKKEEHEQLVKDAARASSAQSRADRLENLAKRHGLLGGGHFKPQTPATPPSKEDQEAAAAEEDQKAKSGLMALAIDPIYREVFDADPTLRDLITKNPLAVLPILAPDALDADDAVALVKEALAKRKPAAPPATPPTPPATPPAPPAGGVNPPGSDVPDAELEAARKIPNTENAIAGMVKVGLKKLGIKK